jgi:nuclear GTP-binding protein
MKLKGNRKSKRQKLSLKYNIQKRVNNHNRRLRKEAKKANGGVLGKRKKKDPGIPNNWPFKEQMLQQLAEKREKAEKEKADKRSKLKKEAERERKRMQKEQRTSEQDRAIARKKKKNLEVEKARKLAFQKLLGQADVLLEVLDARDPLGSRCPSLEAWALAKGKRIVFVLSKADAVPPENVTGWLNALGRVAPTVATQAQLGNKGCLGALQQVLGSFCQTGEKSTRTRFGLVGFDLVGKRTLAKCMRREAQKAKDPQLEMLMRGLLEPIGVVKPTTELDANAAAGCFVRGQTTPGSVGDAVALVGHFLAQSTPTAVMRVLKLPSFQDVTGLLTVFAEDRKVKSKSGKAAPQETVAKRVLSDLRAAGVCCSPPTTQDLGAPLWAPYGDAKSKIEAAMASHTGFVPVAASSSNQAPPAPKLCVSTGGLGPSPDIEALLAAKVELDDVDMDSDEESDEFDEDEDGEEEDLELDEEAEDEDMDDMEEEN